MDVTRITKLRKVQKVVGLVLADFFLVSIAYVSSLLLRFGGWIPDDTLRIFYSTIVPIAIIYVLVFWVFSLYGSLWNTAGIHELVKLAFASGLATVVSFLVMLFTRLDLPDSSYIAGGLLVFLFTGFMRLSYRILRNMIHAGKEEPRRAMIIGAGETGEMMVRQLQEKRTLGLKPVVMVDDSYAVQGKFLRGIRVAGSRHDIKHLVKAYQVEVIVFCAPSASPEDRRQILSICAETECMVKTVPGIREMLTDNAISEVRSLEMSDLLARPEIEIDQETIREAICGSVILVTGGAGSIGSELCRQIAHFDPKKLIIFDVYENSSYSLQMEFRKNFPKVEFCLEIGSVRDKKRLDEVFSTYRPAYVFHAAAHKHVPLMEHNPREAVKNNVFGTLYTAQAADQYGVKRFVLISTDKAVHPSSVMGATKRLAEHVIQYMNSFSKTRYVAVRFGNVLGSNGSVIPIFQQQIEQGGPVTVTHKDMTRYFMTIPEASRLVLQAGVVGHSGEIYILDMGEPVRIDDIARTLIRLSGNRPDIDIAIEYTGLRPGEKLVEELFLDEENAVKSGMNGILIGTASSPTPAEFELTLAYLKEQMYADTDMKKCIKEVLRTYRPLCGNDYCDEEYASATDGKKEMTAEKEPAMVSYPIGPDEG